MGMYDELICRYPLPVEGANALTYQTKSTRAMFMDLYEIREDGTLWHQEYDIEDRSETALWEKENPGKKAPDNLDRFCGCLARVNKRWVKEPPFTGEIVFYSPVVKGGWIEWSAYFENGIVSKMNLIRHET